jgi:hypothetical protein
MPMASKMCKIKNRSYFLTRRMYTDVPSINEVMIIDCWELVIMISRRSLVDLR